MNPIHSGIPEFTDEVSPQAEEKALREKKIAFASSDGSEKPALRPNMGLQSPCQERKLQEITPLPHELQPKWEISAKITVRKFLYSRQFQKQTPKIESSIQHMIHSISSKTFIIAGILAVIQSAISLAQSDPVPDVTNLAVPWPPPSRPQDSPFAKLPSRSSAAYKVAGEEIPTYWGDMDPYDFGPKKVVFDYSGVRILNQVPEPGIHPRIFCTPADQDDIRRRLKTTRCGQEMWKNLLCYTNFMKGTFDPKAEYAKVPEARAAMGETERVPLARLQSGHNQKDAAARYRALIKGDLNQRTAGLWHVFPLEAFRCWIEDDEAGARDLAAAVTTGLKFEQAHRAAAVAKTAKPKPLDQPIAGIQLAYTYDFLYNWLTPEQRKAWHDELAAGSWYSENYGTLNDATLTRSNWATFSYYLITSLAIEGEPGFNDLSIRGNYRGWRNLMTYGWFPSGTNYEAEAKNQLGGDGILAFALRTKAYGFENLAAHPNTRANGTNFSPKSLIPTRDGFVKYDLLGSCHGKPFIVDILALKYLIPGDKVIDFVYRAAVGDHYENVPNRAESGGYDPVVWGSYFNNMIPFLVFATDFDPANDDPAKLGIDHTFFCGDRALMMTRSSWDTNALMLNFHVRQANGGHPFADRNSIMIAGAGRVWAPIYGSGFEAWQNVNNGEVVIDDHPQADHTPGRMVDFCDTALATFAVGDAKYAWDWNWRFNETWGSLGRYTKADLSAGKVKLDPGWELEQHTVNDFSYAKHKDAYLNEPLSMQPSWCCVKGSIIPIARQVNYPVKKAFRTAGIVRGKHEYAIVIDDIQKDDSAHDYKWYLPVEYDVQIAKVETSERGLDLILTGTDPKQIKAPGPGKDQPQHPVPAFRDANDPIPNGQPMLLIRFLNRDHDPKAVPATQAKEPTILEDFRPANAKDPHYQRVRRLAIPAHAIAPNFKVLLYPYRQGESLPKSTWLDQQSVAIEWEDQKDRIDFTQAPTGKTDLQVIRDSKVLVSVNKPISPLAERK
jgi:hypothetical protein